jgi:AcrR family transcriptional regulator
MTDKQPTDVRRKQIAQAALQIIAREGLGGFTTSTLARSVGIAEGTVFRHFGSKKEVVLAAIDRIEELMFAEAPQRTEDPVDDLKQFFLHRMQLMSANPGVARLFFSEELAQAGGQEGAERVREMQRRSLDHMKSCVESATGRGQLRKGMTSEVATVVVHGVALALVHSALLTGTKESLAVRAERVWQEIEKLIRR